MVIKRSPGGPCRWRAVNFEIHLWSSGRNADCIWRSISIQHVQIEAGLNSDPGNDSFWDKSVTLSILLINLLTRILTSTCRSTQVKIASTDLWPQGMFTFSEMLALVESESSFGAYVCHRRPGGSTATSDLVCAEFDGLIFQFPLLYPKYHCSRYAPDIVIFWMSWGFDFDCCEVARLHRVSTQSCTQNRLSPKVQSCSRD